MILVFGGTTEGKKVAAILEQSGYLFCYSTKTATDFKPANYRSGAFTKDALASFCKENDVKVIVHASHPFATELHDTIYQSTTLPVLRYERSYPERQDHPLIKYVPSWSAVLEHLKNTAGLLALTGVQTIEKLKPYWTSHKTIFRILPRESSLAIARQAGFPTENLIPEMPVDDVAHELSMIDKYKIRCILTKESGESGFLSTKIKAALTAGIPIIILERPKLPETFIPVFNEDDLLSQLKQILK